MTTNAAKLITLCLLSIVPTSNANENSRKENAEMRASSQTVLDIETMEKNAVYSKSKPEVAEALEQKESAEMRASPRAILDIDTIEKNTAYSESKPENIDLLTGITITGLVEIEAYVGRNTAKKSVSDIEVATAGLEFSGHFNPEIEASAILLYEETVGTVDLDVAKIEWSNFILPQLKLTAGRDYLAFGVNESLMISDPMTLTLSETAETSLKLSYTEGWAHCSATIFNGDADTGSDKVNNYVLEVGMHPCKGFTASLSYLSNIFEAEALQADIGSAINDKIGGINGYARVDLGDLSLISEFVIAARDVPAGQMLSTGYSAKPQAFSLEADLALSETAEIGFRFEGSEEYEPLPEWSYGTVGKIIVKSDLSLGLELLHNKYRNSNLNDTTLRGQIALRF